MKNDIQETIRRLDVLAGMRAVQRIWPEFTEGKGIFPARMVLQDASAALRDQTAEVERLTQALATLTHDLPSDAALRLNTEELAAGHLSVDIQDGSHLQVEVLDDTVSVTLSDAAGEARLTGTLSRRQPG